jgi:hypothetical protein
MWAVEGCLDRRKGFHTVDDFIATGPMEGSGLVSVGEYVRARRAGRPVEGVAPPAVAARLGKLADAALQRLASLRARGPKRGGELDCTLADIEAFCHLGRYYAAKILGAVELHAARQTRRADRREAAVRHLTEAVGHWKAYADVAAARYRPQLLARTRVLDWRAALADVRNDVRIARGKE